MNFRSLPADQKHIVESTVLFLTNMIKLVESRILCNFFLILIFYFTNAHADIYATGNLHEKNMKLFFKQIMKLELLGFRLFVIFMNCFSMKTSIKKTLYQQMSLFLH